jgi:replicative DNA helicase
MPLLTGERKSGKSITALTIAKNVAHDGGSVLYFSLESPFPEIMDRLYAGESRIPMGLHHHTRLNEEQAAKACKAAESLGKLVFDIRDDVYDLSTMVAIIRQSEATLVIADYAQLIRPNLKDSNREQEVAKISRTLRLIAMETKKPIILLSQLNEQGRSRESRALEQDTTANWNIVFDEDEPNERTIEIPYQRNGESGIRFKVAFLGSIARVENLAYEPPQKEINYA